MTFLRGGHVLPSVGTPQVLRLTNRQSTAWQLHRVLENRALHPAIRASERSALTEASSSQDRAFFGLEHTLTAVKSAIQPTHSNQGADGVEEVDVYELAVSRWQVLSLLQTARCSNTAVVWRVFHVVARQFVMRSSFADVCYLVAYVHIGRLVSPASFGSPRRRRLGPVARS
eukprot:SAG11_NODE_261_length_11530_cov_8.418861_10_plen_172_part_00